LPVFRILTLKMLSLTLHEIPFYASALFTGYLIGSFPTAYLLVKWKASVDIRETGTGNVGTHNAFDVTRSRSVAAAVLLLDLGKGFAGPSICGILFGPSSWLTGLGGIGVVIGHNYPVWLRFKGGRGLAPSAGVMIALGWISVVIWCVAWLLVYAYSRQLHLANVVATALCPFVLWALPAPWIEFSIPSYANGMSLVIVVAVLCSLILLKHAEFFGEIWKSLSINS
jgi:glycerol-3-phosphate acyltransferase PlsY